MLFSPQNEILALSETELYARILPSLLRNEQAYFARPEQKAGGFDFIGYALQYYTADNEVAILPLKGMMSRGYNGYNEQSNSMLIDLLNKAAQTDSIKGVVLDIHSGGGSVDSTKALADTIAKFPKPIATATAFCCSAAYWAASASDQIFMENQSASELGSLGTIYFRFGQKGAIEAGGGTVEVLRSSKAVDKAKDNPFEDLDETTRAAIQQKLDASETELHTAVKLGRVGTITSEEIFTGKTYGVGAALRLGLADQKGTLADAVKWVKKQ